MSELVVSNKIHNYNYAPGIATYGEAGLQGESGKSGNTIFFTNFNISESVDLTLFACQIASNLLPIRNSKEKLSRSYQNGDYFFTQDRTIYELYNIEDLIEGATQRYSKYLKKVGKISADSAKYVKIDATGRLIINSDYCYGLGVGNEVQNTTNAYSNLLIASSEKDANNNIIFINCVSVNNDNNIVEKLKIYYDTNDGYFHIDTGSNPLIVNGEVKLSGDTTNSALDGYSRVLTTEDPIAIFKNICNDITYKISADSALLSTLTITVDGNVSNEIEDRSSAIFVKVYAENTNFLYKLSSFARNEVKTEDTKYTEYTYNIDAALSSGVLAVSLIYNIELFLMNKQN